MEMVSYTHLVPPSYIMDRIGDPDGVSYQVRSDVYVSSAHIEIMRLTIASIFDPLSVEDQFLQRYGDDEGYDDDGLYDDDSEVSDWVEDVDPGLPLWLRDLYFSMEYYTGVMFIFAEEGVRVCVTSDRHHWPIRLGVLVS